MADQTPDQIILPERLVSSVDLSRLIRELKAVDESLRQMELRKPGEPTKLARTGVTLEEIARLNNIQLTDGTQRAQLIELLNAFQAHAPCIHISFAAEPTAKFNRKIVIWMRNNIHPLILLETGLQPTLAAGCMVRTNNKIFDMSLRHHFAENRGLLVQKISEIGAAREATVPSSPAPSPPEPAPALAEAPK